MMDKLLTRFKRNRTAIGYTIGLIDVMIGLADLYNGQYSYAALLITLGIVIIVDTKEFK
jgi:hypothetical protein